MKTNNRSKINIPFTTLDIVIEVLSGLMVIAGWVFAILNYSRLPEIIPTHFGGNGVVNGYGPKSTLFILPGLAVLAYIGLSWVARFPHKLNYLVDITEANAERQYRIAVRMMRTMKLCIITIFFAIDYQVVKAALNDSVKPGGFFTLLILSLVFVPVLYFLIQSSRNA